MMIASIRKTKSDNEASTMEYLSASTRKKQTALLIFCLTSISVSVFQLRLTKIENAGFDILVPEFLLSFILVLSVLYLFAAYLVAFLDEGYEHLSTNRKIKSERDGITRTIDSFERVSALFFSARIEEDFARFAKNEPDQNFDGGQINRNYLRLGELIENGQANTHREEIRQMAEQTKLLCEAQFRMWYRRKVFVGFGGIRFYRVVTFDVAIPLISFGLALSGWIGWLDWVAPWLEQTFPNRQ